MTTIETFDSVTGERTDATAIDTPIEEIVGQWERSTGCVAQWQTVAGNREALIVATDGLSHHFRAES